MTLIAAAIVLSTAGVASPSTSSPRGCSPSRTSTLVSHFVDAFNRGDRSALNNTIWSGRLYFNWYAVTASPGLRVDAESRRRDTLMSYFATRHAADERLVLTTFKLNGVTAGAYRNFEFRLLRSANDLPGGQVAYLGKGASSCATGRLITWTMGTAN